MRLPVKSGTVSAFADRRQEKQKPNSTLIIALPLISLSDFLNNGELFCFLLLFAYTSFFYKQHFYKQCQTKIGKNQANAKQKPKAKLFLFENYSYSSSTLSSKNNRANPKK